VEGMIERNDGIWRRGIVVQAFCCTDALIPEICGDDDEGRATVSTLREGKREKKRAWGGRERQLFHS